jgi:hypothetical protein
VSVIEDIQNRYKKTESAADKYGRIITVRMLTPAKQTTIMQWGGADCPAMALGRLILTAAVTSVNGNPWTFPRNRAELDSYMDSLDEAGLEAAAAAMIKLGEAEKSQQDQLDDSKNLPPTATTGTS